MATPKDRSTEAEDLGKDRPATGRPSYTDWFEKLQEPVPDELIKYRSESWGEVKYLEWHSVAKILDEACGPYWNFEITADPMIGEFSAIVRGRLMIGVPDSNGNRTPVYRDGIGVGDITTTRDGRPMTQKAVKAAASDALKRAAVNFGVGRELYEKEEDVNAEPRGGGYDRGRGEAAAGGNRPSQGRQTQGGGGQGQVGSRFKEFDIENDDPQGSGRNFTSSKQLSFMRNLAADAGVDLVDVSKGLFLLEPEDISVGAAGYLIEHLKGLVPEGGGRGRGPNRGSDTHPADDPPAVADRKSGGVKF